MNPNMTEYCKDNTCPGCGAVVFVYHYPKGKRACPNCGHENKTTKKDLQFRVVQLEEEVVRLNAMARSSMRGLLDEGIKTAIGYNETEYVGLILGRLCAHTNKLNAEVSAARRK